MLILLNALVKEVKILSESENGYEGGNVFGEVFLFQLLDLLGNGAVDTTSDFVV